MKTRKTVTMLVTVTVPKEWSAADARREVRTLVTEQCFYAADEGDMTRVSVKPAKAAR